MSTMVRFLCCAVFLTGCAESGSDTGNGEPGEPSADISETPNAKASAIKPRSVAYGEPSSVSNSPVVVFSGPSASCVTSFQPTPPKCEWCEAECKWFVNTPQGSFAMQLCWTADKCVFWDYPGQIYCPPNAGQYVP